MIQGGILLEVLVMAHLILEEGAIAAVVAVAVVTVGTGAKANLQRVSLHSVHLLNLHQDLPLVLAQGQGPVRYQDHGPGPGLHCLRVIKAPKNAVLAGVQVGAGAGARVCLGLYLKLLIFFWMILPLRSLA